MKIIFVCSRTNKDIEFIEVESPSQMIFFSCVQKKHHIDYNGHLYFVRDIKHIYRQKDARVMMHIEFYVDTDTEELYESKQGGVEIPLNLGFNP